MDKPKHPGGRPTDYNKEIAKKICDLHSSGLSIPKIGEREDMPCMDSIYEWSHRHTEFSEALDHARDKYLMTRYDKGWDLVEDRANDELRDKHGRRDLVACKRDELYMGHLHWCLEKRMAKRFGVLIKNEVTGADGAPLTPTINVTIEKPKS